ncbi:MAG TPA: DHH family phosphoesterase, partial [Geobacterales bacterium]|nr:DHH family phosphoesterase [Geobacterales bacterium]
MTPVMEKRWRLRQANGEQIALFERELGLSPLVARVLVNRGIQGVDGGRRFLSSTLADIRDPLGMKGIMEGVQRLLVAHSRQEQICIYGDYDVDGVTAVALLVHALRRFGFLVTYHIPRRLEDGYGLNAESLREIAARGATLVVTVDCGITAQDEALLARQLGMDLIITDHHTPGDQLPEACAVINPLQPGCDYPFKSLAGVGIAFALLIALRSRFRQEGLFGEEEEPNLRQYLDLVALGTIADVVPLVEENRIFVRHGLLELTAARRA